MDKQLKTREKSELRPESTRSGPVFQPEVDILEDAEGYLVYADLPGVDEQSVGVRLEDRTLSLDGSLATSPDPSWHVLHAEYRTGSFHREFRLSQDIDASRVSAKMRNGVLELRLPKSAESRPRTIQVQAA